MTFLTAPFEKLNALVCKTFGVNVVVLIVCRPDRNGACRVAGLMAPVSRCISAYPGVRAHIALVDEAAAPTYSADWPARKVRSVSTSIARQTLEQR